MFLRLVEDLRFVIGLFFAVISVILIVTGFMGGGTSDPGSHLNLLVGGFMGAFASFMLALAFWSAPE